MRRSLAFLLSLIIFTGCDTPVTNTSACGDGFLDPGEECDGTVPTEITCLSLDYYQQLGALTCKTDCTIERSVCTGRCGDSVIQLPQGEQCEGGNLNGSSCDSLGLGNGELACGDDCRFDSSGCEIHYDCGDGDVTPPAEDCDGENLGEGTCLTLGYYGGDLTCTQSCEYDTSDCELHGRCGDGAVQTVDGEDCEEGDLQGSSCEDFNFYQGNLLCGEDCRYDTSACSAFCGDGIVQSYYEETCDGLALDGEDCQSLGYYGGMLACTEDCSDFDDGDCRLHGFCGDGTIQAAAGEVCDGDEFNGMTCESLGLPLTGNLTCSEDCREIVTASCTQCDTDEYCGASCQDCTLTGQICKADASGCVECNTAADCPVPDESVCHAGDNTCQPNCVNYATVFPVTGGGVGCAGDPGQPVGLSGSQAGRQYQLYRDGVADGAPVPGTGSALDFGQKTTPGTYTVAVVNAMAGCLVSMTGEVVVSLNSAPDTVTASVSIGATCGGQTVTFDHAAHSGGACVGGNWEYEWRDGPDGGGVQVQAWGDVSARQHAITDTTTLYLRMRCSLCPSLMSPSSPEVTVTVPNCQGTCSTCVDGACRQDDGACVGTCSVCSGGAGVYDCVGQEELCTGDCVRCTGGGTTFNCQANEEVCLGTCSTCTDSGSHTDFNCQANETECLGNCDTCRSSGAPRTFNCEAAVGVCQGNCVECTSNGSGTAFNCTPIESECAGTCSTCTGTGTGTEFNCAANQAECVGNCDVCFGSMKTYNCQADANLCTGNCDQCTGSGNSWSCSAMTGVCGGNCGTCSGSGTNYSCAANASLCTGNCDVCSGVGDGIHFNCAENDAACTGNCDDCQGSGTAFNCVAVPSICTGNCSGGCTGGNTNFSCAANAAACTGNCDICPTSGTDKNCTASVALCSGNCVRCTGSGTAFNCGANSTACGGECSDCNGSGTTYNCVADNTECGACEYCNTSYTCIYNGRCSPGTTSTLGCTGGQCKVCSSSCQWGTCGNYTQCMAKSRTLDWAPMELRDVEIWMLIDLFVSVSEQTEDETEDTGWEVF